jgi:hypothetical protein
VEARRLVLELLSGRAVAGSVAGIEKGAAMKLTSLVFVVLAVFAWQSAQRDVKIPRAK